MGRVAAVQLQSSAATRSLELAEGVEVRGRWRRKTGDLARGGVIWNGAVVRGGVIWNGAVVRGGVIWNGAVVRGGAVMIGGGGPRVGESGCCTTAEGSCCTQP